MIYLNRQETLGFIIGTNGPTKVLAEHLDSRKAFQRRPTGSSCNLEGYGSVKALNTVCARSVSAATAVLTILLWPAAARADTPGRLFYEIVVTDPGSRSQGWHGVLYDSGGSPIVAAPGQTVPTSIGEFLNVPCENPWDACGMIRTDMVDWMKVNQANTQIDTQTWSYRLYVYALGYRSESWTGVLLHGDAEIAPGSTLVDTPMGPFRPGGLSNIGWHSTGWTPAGWQPTNTTSAPHH